jgi:Putative viral replication protein
MSETDFDTDLFLRCLQSELFGSLATLTHMSRAKHWCFTLNNYTDEDLQRIADNLEFFEYIIYGKEVGESGTPHLQGFATFKSRVRRNFCIEKIGQAHFTVARNADHSIEYCKKDGDFTEFGSRVKGQGNRSDLDAFKLAVAGGCHDMKKLREDFSDIVAKFPKFTTDYLQDHLPQKIIDFHPLRDWQQALYDALKHEPDSRSIFFIVDFAGNAGKSWFGHYYAFLHDDAQVLLPGKKADMAYALNPLVRVLFIDAPRSKQGDFIQYDFLEDVKNGFVFSPKYESRVKTLSRAHVVVFMNEQPDMNKLSKDRYIVRVVT